MIHKLIGSCQKATEYLERSKHEELGLASRIQFKVHVGLCKVCAYYAKQDHILQQLIQQKISTRPAYKPEELQNLKGSLKELWSPKK